MNYFNNKSGFTLIEVLVAILVFSFGLLGVAGMMTISVRNNHNGYLRSQANFHAENMLDRMRANQAGLWANAYNGDASTSSQLCEEGNACNFSELASFDASSWAQSLALSLPNGQGNINCENNPGLPATVATADAPSIWTALPPFEGVCTITVSWTEANRDGVSDVQTMVLVAQP